MKTKKEAFVPKKNEPRGAYILHALDQYFRSGDAYTSDDEAIHVCMQEAHGISYIQRFAYLQEPLPYRFAQYQRGDRMPSLFSMAAILPYAMPPRRSSNIRRTTAAASSSITSRCLSSSLFR